jgi:hypothetical protein
MTRVERLGGFILCNGRYGLYYRPARSGRTLQNMTDISLRALPLLDAK